MKLTLDTPLNTSGAAQADATRAITLANDANPHTLNLTAVDRVDLQFPKFTDGRAFSQAFLLRRRLGFTGAIRATGDVLVDQLQQMARTGFTEAVLRADQNLAHGEKLLGMQSGYAGFYQGDAVHTQPHFGAEPSQVAA